MPITLNNDKYSLRYYLVIFFITFLFIPITIRLYDLQILRAEKLKEIADKQHSLVIDISPERGQILDRNQKVLATSLKVPSLYAVPRLIQDSEKSKLATKISRIVDEDRKVILERLKRDKAFVWIKRRVTNEMANQVNDLHPHLGIQFETKRFYPNATTFSNLIGITDVDEKGIDGLELYHDRYLRGVKGQKVTKRDAMGREIAALEEKLIPPVNGHNLILNIDQFIQYIVERELSKALTKYNAIGASCVVQEPRTGKILAMVSLPNYDPHDLDKRFEEGKRFRPIVDFYEPGSIFKLVTASAVLNEGVKSEEDEIFCENGEFYFTPRRILHDVHGYGNLKFTDVIAKSSNIGTVKSAMELGENKLYEYIKAFGFGELTGVDFPGEVQGWIRPVSKWSGYSISSIPIGQEITVTPLQMAQAVSVIANDGVMMKPYLLDKILDNEGVLIKSFKPESKGEIISRITAKRMKAILKKVVDEGTGKKARIDGITVAGKTGTAQKILKNGKGYSHSDFISSFVGFAPVENPLVSVSVMIDQPKPIYYGGSVAAPIFREIVKETLFYLKYKKPEVVLKESLP